MVDVCRYSVICMNMRDQETSPNINDYRHSQCETYDNQTLPSMLSFKKYINVYI
jgi:hypothetical protein